MERRNQRLYISLFQVCVHIHAFKLPVDLVLCCISVWIFLPHPSVVIHRRMQGLRSITDIVAQPSGIKKNGCLNWFRIFMLRVQVPVFTHGRLQPLPHLIGDVRLEPDAFRTQLPRLCRTGQARSISRGNKVMASARERMNQVCHFQVNVMVRGLHRTQLWLCRRAPAVRFRAKILNLIHSHLRAHKSRHVSRQTLSGNPVHQTMTRISPPKQGRNGHQGQQNSNSSASKNSGGGGFHHSEYKQRRPTTTTRLCEFPNERRGHCSDCTDTLLELLTTPKALGGSPRHDRSGRDVYP